MAATGTHIVCLGAGLWWFCVCHGKVTDPCPFWPGASSQDEKCFKVFTMAANSSQAQEYCEQQGQSGSLAELTTQDQRRLVTSLVPVNITNQFRVGAKYKSSKSGYYWAKSGKALGVVSILPTPGSTLQLPGANLCVVLTVGELKDSACVNQLAVGFICQRDARPVTNPCYFWDGAFYANKKCLKTFYSSVTWTKALDTCKHEWPGGTLAEPQTEHERRVISRTLPYQHSSVWLGYTDVVREGSFLSVSTNSTMPTLPLAWWITGNPSNTGGNENCVCLTCRRLVDGECFAKLNDLPCTTDTSFTCQKDVVDPCERIMPAGAQYFAGSCYLFVENNLSWSAAQSNCRTLSASLAEPSTTAQQNFVLDMSSQNNTGQVWVGASVSDDELRWSTTGELVKNLTTPNTTSCYLNTDGQARTWLCGQESDKHFSICERDIGDPCETVIAGAVYILGQCFKYVSTPLSWDNAQDYCGGIESFLAEPETKELSDAINLYMKSVNEPNAWIGGRQADGSNHVHWATSTHALSYTLLGETTMGPTSSGRLFIQDGTTWSLAAADKTFNFICQTSANTLDAARKSYVVTSFPKLADVNDVEAFLQITHHLTSYSLLVDITIYSESETILQKTRRLEPQDALNINIDPRIMMNRTGVYTGNVRVQSTLPVTVVMYMFSSSKKLDGSALLLPHSVVHRKGSVASYFLLSSCTETYSVNAVAAMTLDRSSLITVIFPKPSELGTNGVILSKVDTATAATTSKLGSVYLDFNVSFDGAYLFCPSNTSVVIGGAQTGSTDQPGDFVMDQLLPVEFIDNEYVTFPSMFHDVNDFINIMAVEKNTQVVAYKDDGSTDIMLLPNAGDVAEMPLNYNQFMYFKGNTSFYAFKISKKNGGNSACLTSLYPSNNWRQQYNFQLTSRFVGYDVNVAVIVDKDNFSRLKTSLPEAPLGCGDIKGTTLTGCVYKVPSDQPGHYDLNINQDRIAAYMVAKSATSIMCHALGIRLYPQPTNVFDHDAFLASLKETQPCETLTTDGGFTTMDVTTEHTTSTTENSTVPSTTTAATTTPTATTAAETTTTTPATTSKLSTTTPTTTPATTLKLSTTTDVINQSKNSDMTTSAPRCDFIQWTTPSDFLDLFADSVDTLIDLRNTSSYRRSKKSATDDRPSALAIGCLGIICLIVAFGVVALTDLLKVCQWIVGTDVSRNEANI